MLQNMHAYFRASDFRRYFQMASKWTPWNYATVWPIESLFSFLTHRGPPFSDRTPFSKKARSTLLDQLRFVIIYDICLVAPLWIILLMLLYIDGSKFHFLRRNTLNTTMFIVPWNSIVCKHLEHFLIKYHEQSTFLDHRLQWNFDKLFSHLPQC